MTAFVEASPAASPASGRPDRREHRRKPSCPSRRAQQRVVPANGSGRNAATSAPTVTWSLAELLAELVELSREAWRSGSGNEQSGPRSKPCGRSRKTYPGKTNQLRDTPLSDGRVRDKP